MLTTTHTQNTPAIEPLYLKIYNLTEPQKIIYLLPCLLKDDGPTWARTRDLPVMSRWLFQLSYGPELHPEIFVSVQQTGDYIFEMFISIHGERTLTVEIRNWKFGLHTFVLSTRFSPVCAPACAGMANKHPSACTAQAGADKTPKFLFSNFKFQTVNSYDPRSLLHAWVCPYLLSWYFHTLTPNSCQDFILILTLIPFFWKDF